MANNLTCQRQGHTFVLTLHAPQQKNAISVAMREELFAALKEASATPDCRAIVLTGAEGHFSSGGQLQPMNGEAEAPDPERTRRNVGVLHDIVRILITGAKPTVAAVEGIAYGAGFSLAVACDYVIASEGAGFCASFGKVGLMPDAGLLWSLPQRVGTSKARDIMLTARVVGGQEATHLGIANKCVERGKALEMALQVANELTRCAPLAVGKMKEVLARGPLSLEEILSAELKMQPLLASSEDYFEGKAAFKERRPPVFRGL